jgi:hypothetical protein
VVADHRRTIERNQWTPVTLDDVLETLSQPNSWDIINHSVFDQAERLCYFIDEEGDYFILTRDQEALHPVHPRRILSLRSLRDVVKEYQERQAESNISGSGRSPITRTTRIPTPINPAKPLPSEIFYTPSPDPQTPTPSASTFVQSRYSTRAPESSSTNPEEPESQASRFRDYQKDITTQISQPSIITKDTRDSLKYDSEGEEAEEDMAGTDTKMDALKPEPYAGEPHTARDFLTKLKLIFALKKTTFKEDSDKVPFALVFLRDGTPAGIWGREMAKKFLDPPAGAAKPTWTEFENAFVAKFVPTDEAQTSRDNLDRLLQGSASVADYVTAFNAICGMSKLNDEGLIDKFKKGLRRDIKDIIMSQEKLPANLKEWQEKADRIYQNKTSNDFQNGMRGGTGRFLYPEQFMGKDRNNGTARPQGGGRNIRSWETEDRPDLDTRAGYIGDRRNWVPPEEIAKRRTDGSCFKCGIKGHFSKECRKGRQAPGPSTPRVNIRGIEGRDYPPDHPMVQVSRAFMRMSPEDKDDFKLMFKTAEDF